MVDDITLASQGSDVADVNLSPFNFYLIPLVVNHSQTLSSVINLFSFK